MAEWNAESENFFRLVKLIVDVGSKVLRDVLLHIISPDTFDNFIQSNIHIINHLYYNRPKVLFENEFNLLNETPPDLEKFDITLLVKIFRNIIPSIRPNIIPPNYNWGSQSPPGPADIGLADDIYRLREFRNSIFAHISNTRVTNVRFQVLWIEIGTVISRVAGHGSRGFKKTIEDTIHELKTVTVPQSSAVCLLTTLKAWHDEDERFQDIKTELELQGAATRDAISDLKIAQASQGAALRDAISDLLREAQASHSASLKDAISALLRDTQVSQDAALRDAISDLLRNTQAIQGASLTDAISDIMRNTQINHSVAFRHAISDLLKDTQARQDASLKDAISDLLKDTQARQDASLKDAISDLLKDTHARQDASLKDVISDLLKDTQARQDASLKDALSDLLRDIQASQDALLKDAIPDLLNDTQERHGASLKGVISDLLKDTQASQGASLTDAISDLLKDKQASQVGALRNAISDVLGDTQASQAAVVRDAISDLKDTQSNKELVVLIQSLYEKLEVISANLPSTTETGRGANDRDDKDAKKIDVATNEVVEHVCDSGGKVRNEKKGASNQHERIVMLGRRIRSKQEVNVRTSYDKVHPMIVGCAVMLNDYVVLCDAINRKIKLLDPSMALKDSLDLHFPWNVSVVDDNNVIVTLPAMKQLQYVQIFPSMEKGRVLQIDRLCWGVVVVGDNIFVSCHNSPGDGEVRVLDKQGNIKHRLGVIDTGLRNPTYLFSGPNYITVNRAGDKVFVSDLDNHTVTCMTVDGSNIYTYKDKDLHRPSGLYCDDNDNILVCGGDSDNIQMIDAGGHKAGTVVTEEDGLMGPWSIAFRKSDNTLIVSCWKQNNIFVFNMPVE